MLLLKLNPADLPKFADKEARLVLHGALNAVKKETRGLEQDLEKITQIAVPGKLYKGWQSGVVKRIAKEPAGWVFFNGGSRSQGAIKAWSQPGRLRARDGGWLAVPLPAAGPRGRKRDLTPDQWEAANGAKLRYVPSRKGRGALLVLDHGRLTARRRAGRVDRRGLNAGRESKLTVPIFVLIPHQDFANAFAIEPVIDRRRQGFANSVENEVKASLASG